jgi:hypothetical protein
MGDQPLLPEAEPGEPESGEPDQRLPGGELGPATTVTQLWANAACSRPGADGVFMSGTANSVAGGLLFGFWSVSAWTTTDNMLLQTALLAGSYPQQETDLLANPSKTHLALPRRRVVLGSYPPGPVPIKAKVLNDETTTDGSDRISLTLVELGSPPIWQLIGSYYGKPVIDHSAYWSQPITTRGSDLLVCVSATGYTHGTGMLGANLSVDDEQIASLSIYANSSQMHMAMVPADYLIPGLGAGAHMLELAPAAGTVIDDTDFSGVMVFELLAPQSVARVTAPFTCDPARPQAGGGVAASGLFASSGGTLIVTAAASAYAGSDATLLSMSVRIDGTDYGSMQILANYASVHLCLVGDDLIVTGLPAGLHTVQLVAAAGTVTDGFDRCSVTVIEVPTTWT